ncbi:MAG: hypothetical protein AB1468_03420 [Candidatus Micrarchaeota archaeon]
MDKKIAAGIMSVVFALIIGGFIAVWFNDAYELEWYMPIGIGAVLVVTLSALFYNLLLNK